MINMLPQTILKSKHTINLVLLFSLQTLFNWLFCCHSSQKCCSQQFKLLGSRGNTKPRFFFSACLNNLQRELSDPISEPVPPRPQLFPLNSDSWVCVCPLCSQTHQQEPFCQRVRPPGSQTRNMKAWGQPWCPCQLGYNGHSGDRDHSQVRLERQTPEVADVQTPV